jgi:hypothetical protein
MQAQLRIKRVCFLQAGLSRTSYFVCIDSDHNGLNEIIFPTGTIYSSDPLRWEVWEYRPVNRYELVFADTGAYPYPPGITTGNFLPFDVGDIDRDSLIDLVGRNIEKALSSDTLYYIIETQESPNHNYYPESLSWHYRLSSRGYGSTYYFTNDLDRDGRNEILTFEEWDSFPNFRIAIFENVSNNQNIPVWRHPSYGSGFTFGDFDRDSLKEFITANPGSSGQVYVYENTGPDQYQQIYDDTVNRANGSDVFSGNDLDGDGRPAFFVAFYSYPSAMNYLYMWKATGNNTYQRTLIDQLTGGDWSDKRSMCDDIDGDGIDEVVWSIGGAVFVYKVTGNNQFQRVWSWGNDHGGTLPTSVVNIYDMNNDGYKEIVVGGSGKTSIFEMEAIRVLSPNGGEIFHTDSNETIYWQTFHPPRCDSLSLFYSIDNGRTYQQIVHGLQSTDTSYVWTVPYVNSDSCKIKVITYGPGWQYDESDGVFSITSTGIEEHKILGIKQLSLKISPDIFRNQTTVNFSMPFTQRVSLKLYNIAGKLIKVLCNEEIGQGIYKISLNSKDLSSGVYFLTLQTTSKKIIERLVIVK